MVTLDAGKSKFNVNASSEMLVEDLRNDIFAVTGVPVTQQKLVARFVDSTGKTKFVTCFPTF